LAIALREFAGLSEKTGAYAEAEGAYKRAVAIYERLAAENPPVYESRLAEMCSCQGSLYFEKMDRSAEAEELAKQALSTFERLGKKYPGVYDYNLQCCYEILSKLYKAAQRPGEEQEMKSKNIEYLTKLAFK